LLNYTHYDETHAHVPCSS